MDPKELQKIHEEHLERALAVARDCNFSEEGVRRFFDLLMIHALINSPNAPQQAFSGDADRNRYLAYFTGLTEREAGERYAEYVVTKAQYPSGWPDFAERPSVRQLH